MLYGKIFFIKDKQAFKKEEGVLRLIGKSIEVAKKAKEDGATLIHFIDLDAQKGLNTNFDVYDKLSYIVNIEVEGVKDDEFVVKLLSINVRVVFELPTPPDSSSLNTWKEKFKEKPRLLVGILAGTDVVDSVSFVHDVILPNPNPELVSKLKKLGKRIIVYKKDYEKMKNKRVAFLVLND